MRRWLLIASGLLLVVLAVIVWQESHRIKPIALIPTLTGQVEYCLTCHSNLAQISSSHPVQTFGCVICHGGERLALTADLAHSTMRGRGQPLGLLGRPGFLRRGQLPQWDRRQLQRPHPEGHDQHPGDLCRRDRQHALHLWRRARPDGPLRHFRRPGPREHERHHPPVAFCSCAVLQSGHPGIRLQLLELPHLRSAAAGGSILPLHRLCGLPYAHPDGPGTNQTLLPADQIHELTTKISYAQCDTCHNRGNYDLRTMTFQPRQDQPTDRLHDYYQPIAQFTSCEWKLDCVDCHTRVEAMGDGSLYSSESAIQYVQCKTCHGTSTDLPETRTLTDPNDIAFRLAQLNPVRQPEAG